MADRPHPTEDAKAAFAGTDAELAIFKSAYDKFLRTAEIPNKYTAIIPLEDFSDAERNSIVNYLKHTGVHSTIVEGQKPNTQQIVIRDGDNAHLQGINVIQIITDQKEKLVLLYPDVELDDAEPIEIDIILPDDEPLAAAPEIVEEAKPAEALYIPAFNTLTTEKGAYILLDHMYVTEVTALAEALESRGITFDKDGYDSPSYGNVFVVRFNMQQYEELGKMMKEAREQGNLDKAPEGARIYPRPKGDPAINVLDGGRERHIPIDGMLPNQISALEARLNKVDIPYTLKMKSEHGPVLAVAEDYEDKLDALRKVLRAEHNARKAETVITPRPSENREPGYREPA